MFFKNLRIMPSHRCVRCHLQDYPNLNNVPFHKFPTSATRRQMWLQALKLDIEMLPDELQSFFKRNLVCGRHFKADNYELTDGQFTGAYRRLKCDAVPTLVRESEWNLMFEQNDEFTFNNADKKGSQLSYIIDVIEENNKVKKIPFIQTDIATTSGVRHQELDEKNEPCQDDEKFTVFGSQLRQLFQFCTTDGCEQPVVCDVKQNDGVPCISWFCLRGHEGSWTSQGTKVSQGFSNFVNSSVKNGRIYEPIMEVAQAMNLVIKMDS